MSSDAHLHGNITPLVSGVQDTMPISKEFIGAVADQWQLYRSAIVGDSEDGFELSLPVIHLQIIRLVSL